MARLALILFSLFLVVIVVLANQGLGFWGFLQDIPLGDKLGHLGLVGIFALLLNLTLRNRRLPKPLDPVLCGTAVVAVIMTLEESSQLFLPHRSPDLLDGLANLAGAALGQFAASATASLRRA